MKEEIEEYYGCLAEIRAGIRKKPPEKPPILQTIDLMRKTGLPLVSGGLLDQPYTWLLQYSAAMDTVEAMEAINGGSNAASGSKK